MLGAVVLVAGTVPILLIAIGDDPAPAPALFHLPRPIAGDLTNSAVDRPTPGAEQTGSGATQEPRKPEYEPSSVVVSLRDPANTASITSRGGTVIGEIAGTGFVKVRPPGDPAAFVEQVTQDPSVTVAALNYGRRTSAIPNDELYGSYQQTYLDLIRMPAAWDLLTDTSSQVVAVVDTGVDATHPDLAGRLVSGYNVVAPGSPPSDVDGHGTFVAGVVAANANNGTGIAGVTWNGRVMPVKVFDGDLAWDWDIAVGVVWAVDRGASVINLSLGGPDISPLLQAVVQYATDRNVVVVAASGNEGSSAPQYPAAFSEVIAVGATDEAGKLVDFSSYGPWLDLTAPGWSVASTVPGGYAVGDGTSFAAPMVAGVAAMIRAQNPALTPAQVGDRLRAATRDAGPRGFDQYYGFGVLDAARALGAPFAADLPMPDLGPGEPNDVPERAIPISASTITATLAIEGDVDWYRYDANSRMQLTLFISPPASFDPSYAQNLQPEVAVYDANLTIVTVVGQFGGSIEVPEGTVYLRVSNRNGAADTRPYQMLFSPGSGGLDYYVASVRMGDAIDPGPRLAAVDIGDVTGDGRADVVVSTRQHFLPMPNDNRIFVLPQQNGQALAEPIWYTPVQPTVPSLTLADVDQDARLDVVAAGSDGIEWFRQTPGVGLTSQGLLPVVSGSFRLVTAADVDGDGDSDLVAAPESGDLVVLTHGTSSSFTAATIPASSDTGIDIAVGDVDGDTRPDVVSTNGDLQVFHNAAAGWTRTDHVPVGRLPVSSNDLTSVAIADFTGDGLLDVAGTVSASLGVVNVFRQNPDHTLADPQTKQMGDTPRAVAVGDINGDSRGDLAVMNGPDALFARQQPDGSLGPNVQVRTDATSTYVGPQGLAVGDLDGDGLADLAFAGDTALSIVRHRAAPASGTGMVVQSVSPIEYATEVPLDVVPHVVFGPGMEPSTVNSETVRLMDGRNGATVAASLSFDPQSRTATITPTAPLHRATPYRIVVEGVRGLLSTSGLPARAFASTFTTTSSGPMPAMAEFAVRGRVGAAAVSAVPPIGDLGDVIVRYAPGATPPASPSGGSAGYSGVGGGIMIDGLTPGQTYSFSVWYRDRSGNLSPSSTATLIGTTLSMTSATTSNAGPGQSSVTFVGAVSTPAGPGAGVLATLMASCVEGPFLGTPVATATGAGSGSLSATVAVGGSRCIYRWEIMDSTLYMGAVSGTLRVSGGGVNLPPGQEPPRER